MRLGFIFPGQGSQAIGMGRDFIDNHSIARDILEESSEILKINMRNLLFNENDNINKTRFTQPAILLISYIAYILFREQNKTTPIFGLGHSLGEITANVIANAISFRDALMLVYKRGELMQKVCEGQDAGMAVVIGLEDSIIEDFCNNTSNIWCANYNANGQIVLAGSKQSLLNAEEAIKKLGAKKFLLLPMSVASHCPLLYNMTKEFKAILDDVLIDNFDFEIISNATMESYNTKNKALELLTMQLTSPVFYKQSIINNQEKIDCFIEFGYGNILKGLNKRLSNKPTYSVGNISSLQTTLEIISK